MNDIITVAPTPPRAVDHRLPRRIKPVTTRPTGARHLSPADMVGNTPVAWISEPLSGPGQGFWAKLEGANPNGIKDRPGLYMVEQAKARGDLKAGARIVESTSGTLGLGLALAGIVHQHPVTLVTDPGLEPAIVNMLAAHGATVDMVSAPHPEGGWQQARKDRVAQLLAQDPGAWCPDQYQNPDNVTAYAPLAAELIAQLGTVDVLIASVGTGGHSAGVSRILHQHNPHMQLIGVDTIGSTIFGQPAATRLMRGLGSSIYPDNVDYSAFDEVHWVAPHEAVWAARTLAATHHSTGGWSVGAVALVAGWAARRAAPGTQIAAIFPDGPLRYHGTIFDDDYCRTHNLLGRPPAAGPERIESPTDSVVQRWTRCTNVIDPIGALRAIA